MDKHEVIAAFDPNAASSRDSGIFGLPFTAEYAAVIIIPIAWEATVSFTSGTAQAPLAILEASKQIDLHHHDYPDAWKSGYYIDTFSADMALLAHNARTQALSVIKHIEAGKTIEAGSEQEHALNEVNTACTRLNEWVKNRCAFWKEQGKQVCLLGGDHSTPLGYFQYHAGNCDEFGILHIDAHHDLRVAYEGFTYSHASIFYNALTSHACISKLVQVGIRDYCDLEYDYVCAQHGRINVFYDREIRSRLYRGECWHDLCRDIIACLPQNVHISIDIDGLDPVLSPNTGTPVPGGLAYEELMFLLNEVRKTGRNLIGFDLCEVAPGGDGWDANVGARVLFHLCALAASQV